jgi:hypothetical protein
MTLMMGREGVDLVRQFAARATGQGVARDAYWGEIITSSLPKAVVGQVVDVLRRKFIRQFALRGGAGILGRAIPFGIGAAIGGVGNHVLGRRVLQQARLAFGAAPALRPVELEPRDAGESGVARAARRGGAIGSVLAGATSRGIRSAGRALTRRRRDSDQVEGPAASPGPDGPVGPAGP